MSKTKLFAAGFIVCLLLIVSALFMQYQMGLEPCPLCLLQRIAFMAIGAVCLLALIIRFDWFGKLSAVLLFLIAGAGIGLSGRQLWLQSLPEDQVPTCGPGFEYMVENFPLSKALSMILSGSGECAEVQWTFLGLSIPGWSLLFFLGFMALALYILFRKNVSPHFSPGGRK